MSPRPALRPCRSGSSKLPSVTGTSIGRSPKTGLPWTKGARPDGRTRAGDRVGCSFSGDPPPLLGCHDQFSRPAKFGVTFSGPAPLPTRRFFMLRAIAAGLLLSYPSFSQPSPTPLHFDVASIKATSTVPDQWKGAGEAAISFSPDS